VCDDPTSPSIWRKPSERGRSESRASRGTDATDVSIAAVRRRSDREGLGWFSSALGSIEVLARGVVARAIGTRGSSLARMVTRVCGLREAASGVGILTAPRPEITAT
jgi:hypothetical protein